MKIVHIAYKYGQSNTGGAAIAATRLHKALLEYGFESHYVCVWKCEDGVNVHELPRKGFGCRWLFLLMTKISRGIWRLTSYRKSIFVNVVPLLGLSRVLNKVNPDIVHLHWINADVMSLGQLQNLKYNIVVNLHDLYMINAIEPHPRADTRYISGFSAENSTGLERWMFHRKNNAIKKIRPIFIAPSHWACTCARNSIIGGGCKAVAISNLIDEAFHYEPEFQKANADKFVIVFGAYGGRRVESKGFNDLTKALQRLPLEVKSKCELLVFGEIAEDSIVEGVTTKFQGPITTVDALIKLYSSADVFAFPSLYETQGMTKVEAMLCGLPVVAFNRTACAEGIIHRETGWVAKNGDSQSFATGLKYYFIVKQKYGRDSIHKSVSSKAREMFSTRNTMQEIVATYKLFSSDKNII